MSRPIKDSAEAVKVSARIIAAQDRLLAAHKSGTLRAPASAIDTLTAQRPRFEAWLEREDVPDPQITALKSEVERLHTWDGLMELLDEHWPESMIPTLDDDETGDTGPRIVSLMRWVKTLKTEAGISTAVPSMILDLIKMVGDPEDYNITIGWTDHRWVGQGLGDPETWNSGYTLDPHYYARAYCNDLFTWGSADSEDITPANVHVLVETFEELKALDAVAKATNEPRAIGHLSDLFSARVRRMRPQGAALPTSGALRELFLAAGPAREIDFTNPKSIDGEYQYTPAVSG